MYGATGHTGRFIVAELVARGFTPIVSGRDQARLDELAVSWPGAIVRPATVDDPASLDRALAGSAAVINAAGPFAVTGGPVVEAALRARIPYVDVAAEIEANAAMFETYADWLAKRGSQWCRRWRSSAGWAICWRPQPWASGPPPTPCTSPTA